MKKQFAEINFSKAKLTQIGEANAIIAEYLARGQKLTVRQLYYRLVTKNLIENTLRSYKNLGRLIDQGRQAGLIDWDMIEDRTRQVNHPSAWANAQDMIASAARWYQEDLWLTQPNHVEAWIEKEALIGVIAGVCEELRIPHFACRGYVSQSEAYSSGRRFFDAMLRGKRRDGEVYHKRRVVILHLGDHDPSGIDMTRDVQERLRLFSEMGHEVEVRRLALNMDQIEEYGPPPNPAKVTDSRFAAYEAQHGDESWELDALSPEVISDLIRDEIENPDDPLAPDRDAWETAEAREAHYQNHLQEVFDRWSEVKGTLDLEDFGAEEDEE